MRIAVIAAAILVVGALAFAVAEAAQSPRVSQIPTVVAGHGAALSIAAASPAPGGPHAFDATTPVTSSSPTETASTADGSTEQREVVTPKVRGDKDGDEGSSAGNDHDGDEPSGSSSKKESSSESEHKASSSGSSSKSDSSEKSRSSSEKSGSESKSSESQKSDSGSGKSDSTEKSGSSDRTGQSSRDSGTAERTSTRGQ
jgi:hypothetical protein